MKVSWDQIATRVITFVISQIVLGILGVIGTIITLKMGNEIMCFLKNYGQWLILVGSILLILSGLQLLLNYWFFKKVVEGTFKAEIDEHNKLKSHYNESKTSYEETIEKGKENYKKAYEDWQFRSNLDTEIIRRVFLIKQTKPDIIDQIAQVIIEVCERSDDHVRKEMAKDQRYLSKLSIPKNIVEKVMEKKPAYNQIP